ncbi:ferritin-like domain-containing protein [Salinimicrobium sp. GXAS 041]|uniref:ferritin-like domain-containing protein n=1 Tax=Salinimicrobium sp. GXAS 041 TaxID=3400806 RepID=UPI003C717003
MKYSEEMADKLNELLEKNYDSEKGFRNAAEDVQNSRLKGFFEEKAAERYDFGHELKTEIRNFGEAPDKGSSIKADAHRTWMNLKSALSGNNEEAVLEEVIRGEKLAVENYNEVIEKIDFPPSTKNLLLKQRNAIQQTIENAKSLEESFS